MEAYPCPACGGTATREGCRKCGRPYDAQAAALAMLQRSVASLEAKKRQLVVDQTTLREQLAHASAQRDALAREVRRKLASDDGGSGRSSGKPLRAKKARNGPVGPRQFDPPSGPTVPPPSAEGTPPTGPPPTGSAPDGASAPSTQAAPGTAGGAATMGATSSTATSGTATGGTATSRTATMGATRTGRRDPSSTTWSGVAAPPTGTRITDSLDQDDFLLVGGGGGGVGAGGGAAGQPGRAGRRIPGPRRRLWTGAARGTLIADHPTGPGRAGGAEITTGSAQAVPLGLGGLLLAAAALIVALFDLGDLGAAGRLALLAAGTVAMLLLPLALTRRGLVATAETIAAVGLLMVALNGYAVWRLGHAGSVGTTPTVYFGLICLFTAAVAAGYSALSKLYLPQYATLLLLQPVLPLLAYRTVEGPLGWALVFAGLAVINLALTIVVGLVDRWAAPAPPQSGPGAAAPPPSEPGTAATPQSELGATAAPQPDQGTAAAPASWRFRPAPLLRNLGLILYALAYGTAVAYAAVALIRADTLGEALPAGLVLVLTAAIALASSANTQHTTASEVTAGLSTLAVILSVTRVAAVAAPEYAILFAAGAILLTALLVPVLPQASRRGPQIAVSFVASTVGAVVLIQALPAIIAPIRAATPIWAADLSRYRDNVADAAGPAGWQLTIAGLLLTVAAGVMLPSRYRQDAIVVGATATLLTVPATLRLDSPVIQLLTLIVAVGLGVLSMNARTARSALVCLGAALVVGGYAAAVSLTRPTSTALVLAALTVVCVVLATAPGSVRTDPYAESVRQTVADIASGGAALGLPGSVAAAAAVLVTSAQAAEALPAGTSGASLVLAATFIAVAASLTFAALTQVAYQRPNPPLLAGASAAALVTAVAAIATSRTNLLDVAVAVLLLAGAVLLWLAPVIDARSSTQQWLQGSDVAFAVITSAAIGAFARATALVSPDSGLVIIAAIVLAVALAVRAMPALWRRGPVVGAGLVGSVIAAVTGAAAVAAGVGVIHAGTPVWSADLGAWSARATTYSWAGWQAPVALLLLGIAATVAMPRPFGDDVSAALFALAAVAAPVAFDLPWWSPLVLSGLVATGLGVTAAFTPAPRAAYGRLMVAGALGLYGAGASLLRPGATTAMLFGLVMAGTVVAATAAVLQLLRADDPDDTRSHLVIVGCAGTAGALLALAGSTAAFTATAGHGPRVLLAASLAASALGLAAAALLLVRTPTFLPAVTAGVAGGATITALAAVQAGLNAGVYAATAALLGVLAELLRAGHRPPARTRKELRARGGFGFGVVAAAGLPATIALLGVLPAVAAALISPYRWLEHPWSGSPASAADTGWLDRWTASPGDVAAATILTIAAALAAVGLGGGEHAVSNRAVAALIPGAAVTLLIAPAALHAPYPMQATAALLVATIAILGLALTVPPVPSVESNALRVARWLVLLLGLLAAGAGNAGSLATRHQTVTALGATIIVGLIGAYGGKTPGARIFGWQIAASSAVLFAFTASLAAGLPLYWCALPVLAVCALLLAGAGTLPEFRRERRVVDDPPGSLPNEIRTIELTAYVGAGFALFLAWGHADYLAAVCIALGAILGMAAARPERGDPYRTGLLVVAAISEAIGLYLLLNLSTVGLVEGYTVPFALVALLGGVLELHRRTDLGSWLAYGPALVAGFLPTLAIVLVTEASPLRRVLLLIAGVLTVAIGALRRQKAPVVVGTVVTAIAAVHEVFLLGGQLPAWLLVGLFTITGLLLTGLGAGYEKRRQNMDRLRGALGRLR